MASVGIDWLPEIYRQLIGKNAGHCADIPVTPEEDEYFKRMEGNEKENNQGAI